VKGQTNKALLKAKLQRRLRKSLTDAEQHLWRSLRREQVPSFRFRRQHPFGDYIIDFVCLEAMLAIEIDGGQHGEQTTRDTKRTEMLEKAGFRVLRFWNNEVLQETEAVMAVIWKELKTTPSPP
jgi:very-short-patch-repair endonuclease